METRRTFSREYQLEALKMVKDWGVAVRQVSRGLDIKESMLRRWIKEFGEVPRDPSLNSLRVP